jgi:mannose-1-phosphate guanylyltransferase
MKTFVVIMAGGIGSRFWPRSREKTPKQLLKIVSQKTMLQNTIARLEGLVDFSDILIITTKSQKAGVVSQVPQIPIQNIITEPFGRNTAPCLGLAALFVERADPEAVMAVICADHTIHDEVKFRDTLKKGIEIAYESKSILTMGIVPRRPDTGFGYIQYINDKTEVDNPYFDDGIYKVRTFAEKPNLQTAERFIKSGDFLWNSGMFIWRTDVILEKFKQYLPDLYDALMNIKDKISDNNFDTYLEQMYKSIKGISIDYGVMEKTKDVLVMKSDFGWSDLGSWDEVYNISSKDDEGNATIGQTVLQKTSNCYIYSPDKLVATIDVDDLIIINTNDALLICKREKSQEVKEVVDYLKRKKMNDYL